MRRLAPLLALLLLAPLAPFAGAADAPEAAPPKPVRVAVIDTGINASHPEFAPGQVVAWKDFTEHASPVPVDVHGHGTATASLVAGLNAGSCGSDTLSPKLSFAPGAELVVARVGNDAGAITGNLAQAWAWAVAQGADVVSMSIGGVAPLPFFGSSAIGDARAAGALPVVSAGNGLLNAGAAPYPSWSTTYGNDHHALVVGAGSRFGGPSTTGNLEPDVASWSDGVCVARTRGGYGLTGGTSFSAPLVAGMAAKAIEVARASGQPDSPDHVERLLLLSARNSPNTAYAFEGMGFLLDGQWPTVAAHAAAGTFPDYDAQGPHAAAERLYHDQVTENARRTL